MIANVEFKMELRVRNLLDVFYPVSRIPHVIKIARDNYPMLCGHFQDGRCRLASMVARELPGSAITVYDWRVNVVPPELYGKVASMFHVRLSQAANAFIRATDDLPRSNRLIRYSCQVVSSAPGAEISPLLKGVFK